jgi:hypothetical protein
MADLIPFNTIEEYEEYVKNVHPTKIYTIAERDALSPDNIDNAAFWMESYRKFGNYIYSPINKADVYDCESAMVNSNALAMGLNALSSFNGQLLFNAGTCKILEIGPGLGNLYQYLSRFPIRAFEYYCYDIFYPDSCVIPNSKRIVSNNPNLLSNFDAVYSINVWQHFTMTQWLYYIKSAYEVLNDTGRLIISFYHNGKINCEDGLSYTYAFGQLTPVVNGDIYQLLHDNGFSIVSRTNRFDGTECLILSKIKKEERNVT